MFRVIIRPWNARLTPHGNSWHGCQTYSRFSLPNLSPFFRGLPWRVTFPHENVNSDSVVLLFWQFLRQSAKRFDSREPQNAKIRRQNFGFRFSSLPSICWWRTSTKTFHSTVANGGDMNELRLAYGSNGMWACSRYSWWGEIKKYGERASQLSEAIPFVPSESTSKTSNCNENLFSTPFHLIVFGILRQPKRCFTRYSNETKSSGKRHEKITEKARNARNEIFVSLPRRNWQRLDSYTTSQLDFSVFWSL